MVRGAVNKLDGAPVAKPHGFRNSGSQKRAFSGGNADCSKTALFFSSHFGQALGLVAAEGLQKQPSDIIVSNWR